LHKLNDDIAHDKHAIAKSFGDAASTYNVAAELQQRIGDKLLCLLNRHFSGDVFNGSSPARVLDIGCGTGYILNHLAEQTTVAYGLDIAEGMLGFAKRVSGHSHIHYVCADAEAIPLADNSLDIVVSNFAIQWCPNKTALFNEISRVLSPGGLCVFSMPGADTLCELKSSWNVADPDHSHVNQFCSVEKIANDIECSALTAVSLETEIEMTRYTKLQELTQELKAIGAHNVTDGRARQLTGKGTLKRLVSAYETYRQEDGLLPATWNVIFGVLVSSKT